MPDAEGLECHPESFRFEHVIQMVPFLSTLKYPFNEFKILLDLSFIKAVGFFVFVGWDNTFKKLL